MQEIWLGHQDRSQCLPGPAAANDLAGARRAHSGSLFERVYRQAHRRGRAPFWRQRTDRHRLSAAPSPLSSAPHSPLLVGQLGMRVAIEGNIRVASEAVRGNYNGALTVAYRAGTFTGMLTDGLGLLGGTAIFMVFGTAAPDALLGFGFGGTVVALFMRIGGGIYTKAADVGADLVGKVEQDLPEDDPRNAAVVADLVGDNVGDCAGMAADIFESYEVTIVSTLILGIVLFHLTGETVLDRLSADRARHRRHLFDPGHLHRAVLGKRSWLPASKRCRRGNVPLLRSIEHQHRDLGLCVLACSTVASGNWRC